MEQVPLQSDDEGISGLSPEQSRQVISQVQKELADEVARQNRNAAAAARSEGNDMREISNVANTMRAAIAALKQRAASAASNFQSEVNNTHANLDKVDSVTTELKEANKEVESMLGESGSNFPPPSDSTTPRTVDENGVWVNPDNKK